MNKKYNKSYLLIGSTLVVLIGLSLCLGVVIPGSYSYYTLAVNIINFLVSIILMAFVSIHDEEFYTPIKVITSAISCLTFIVVVINIFILF